MQIRCTAHNLRTAGFTKYKITYQKGPTFSFDVYCCTHWVGWRSQRQSEKVNIRNACFLPVRAKSGRFCVLMQGRAWIRTVSFRSFGLQQQSTLRIGRTEVCIHLIWLSQIGSLFRWTQKPVRQQGVQQNHRSLAEEIKGHTRSSSATEFCGLCPPLSSRQEVLFLRGIVLTQTISQKRQTRQRIVVTPSKSLSHNGFRISCFCDFYRNQVETTEFANGETIHFYNYER